MNIFRNSCYQLIFIPMKNKWYFVLSVSLYVFELFVENATHFSWIKSPQTVESF